MYGSSKQSETVNVDAPSGHTPICLCSDASFIVHNPVCTNPYFAMLVERDYKRGKEIGDY